MATGQYALAVHDADNKLLAFLRVFEFIQENMRVERLGEFQGQLREVAPDGFDSLIARLGRSAPPDSMLRFHDAFTAAIRHLGNASQTFLNADESSYSLAGLDMRRALCRGLNLLYGIREHTPKLQEYWLLSDAMAEREALETPSPDADAPVGMMHRRRTSPLTDYSLYVPESYTPGREWPLIVCLHGAYGRGDHYIWSWLRASKEPGVSAAVAQVAGRYLVDTATGAGHAVGSRDAGRSMRRVFGGPHKGILVWAVRRRHIHLPAGAWPPGTVRGYRTRRSRFHRDDGRYAAAEARD